MTNRTIIARGGFGVIYASKDSSTGEQVADKCVTDEIVFRRELRFMIMLRSVQGTMPITRLHPEPPATTEPQAPRAPRTVGRTRAAAGPGGGARPWRRALRRQTRQHHGRLEPPPGPVRLRPRRRIGHCDPTPPRHPGVHGTRGQAGRVLRAPQRRHLLPRVHAHGGRAARGPQPPRRTRRARRRHVPRAAHAPPARIGCPHAPVPRLQEVRFSSPTVERVDRIDDLALRALVLEGQAGDCGDPLLLD